MSNPRAAQLVEAGMWLRLSGDHEGAKRLFEQALKLDPDNARAKELLEAGSGAAAPAPQPPPPVPPLQNPFAPPATTTSMDLDWGSATGFAPTPVPFIPPIEVRHSVPVPLPQDSLELPVELDIEAVSPPVFGDETASGTLVFGLGAQANEVPAPAPTVPEFWANEPAPPTRRTCRRTGSGTWCDRPSTSRPSLQKIRWRAYRTQAISASCPET